MSESVLAFVLPPAQCSRRSSSSGRAVQTISNGTAPARSASRSMKSSSASSAQWMSSNTSTVGPSSASASKNRRHAANASTRPLVTAGRCRGLQPDEAAAGAATPSRDPAHPSTSAATASESFASATRRVVGLQDAGLGLDHLAQRPERDALAVGKRAAAPPRDQLRQLLDVSAAAPPPAATCRSPAHR